jgi:hypothetical protein
MDDSPLAFANRYSGANALEVFKRNSSLSVFGLSHDGFRDTMVNVFLKAPFTTASLFKQSLSGLRSLMLKLSAKARETSTNILELVSSELLAVRCGGD